MFKSKYSMTALLALGLLGACTHKNNDQAPIVNPNIVPQSISFSKPLVGPELTKEQVDQVKKEFKVKSTMILPPGELVFPDKSMSAGELKKREDELRQKDANSFALLMDMRSGCRKGHPTMKFDATFPTDEVTDESQLLVGDKVEGSGSAGLVGSNCPVDYSGGMGIAAEVTDKNEQQKEVTARAGESFKLTAVMKNSEYAKLLGMRGMIVDASISGLAIRRDVVANKYDRALFTFNMSGSYLSLNSDIPYSVEVKALVEGNVKPPTNTKLELVADMKLQFPGFFVDLVVHQVSQDQLIVSQEYYLNGHPKTEAELRDLFGQNIPVENLHKNQLIQALK